MRICKMCLSHIFHHQHVSIAVAIITKKTYKIARNPDKLLKQEGEPLSATQHMSKFIHGNWILAY